MFSDKFVKVSTKGYGINLLYCVSLPGYTYQCALKCTDIKLQTLQDKDLILLLENNISGCISSVMGDRNVKLDVNKKVIYVNAFNIYGHPMSQIVLYDEIELWYGRSDVYMGKLEEIFNTPDDNDIGYFVEFDLKYPDKLKKKQNIFHFLQRIRKLFLINIIIL